LSVVRRRWRAARVHASSAPTGPSSALTPWATQLRSWRTANTPVSERPTHSGQLVADSGALPARCCHPTWLTSVPTSMVVDAVEDRAQVIGKAVGGGEGMRAGSGNARRSSLRPRSAGGFQPKPHNAHP